MAATGIPVVITYHKPGTRPPIYVAGTFSDPPWQPLEMEHTMREDGEHEFKKEVYGEAGSTIQYKFRVGEGDWWVLDGETPTVTDNAGNTNHILEVKPLKERVLPHIPKGLPTERNAKVRRSSQNAAQQPPGPQDVDDVTDLPKSGKAVPKRLQAVIETEAGNRSGTGTPIFARTAAEVADSAALLHEEVPRRETPRIDPWSSNARKGTPTPLSEDAETAAEVADTAEALDNDEVCIRHPAAMACSGLREQNTILILEQPPDQDETFEVQGPGETPLTDQDEYIADKSPLFAHECAGLYESDQEAMPADIETRDHAEAAEPMEDADSSKVDLDDPTLERFPSGLDDIMDTVRRLETGLQMDESFDAGSPSSVFNPSRRGTEDITGDFVLTAPSSSSPVASRGSKGKDVPRSPRASLSGPASGSLHSIEEAEEPTGEEEAGLPPAVVFSNPMKPKPKHLKLPSSFEDEGVSLPDGVSPRTVKPEHRRIVMPEGSPPPEDAGKSGDTESARQPIGGLATASSIAVESAGDSEQLRRRGAQEDPPKPPDSVHLTGLQARKGGGWIRAFLRLLFVDLIGGLFRRLTGGKRKT